MGFHACVRGHVHGQLVRTSKGFGAHFTFVWTPTRVLSTDMQAEILLDCVSLVAFGAHIRLLASVFSQVDIQVLL